MRFLAGSRKITHRDRETSKKVFLLLLDEAFYHWFKNIGNNYEGYFNLTKKAKENRLTSSCH
jgi:hypothetical protein